MKCFFQFKKHYTSTNKHKKMFNLQAFTIAKNSSISSIDEMDAAFCREMDCDENSSLLDSLLFFEDEAAAIEINQDDAAEASETLSLTRDAIALMMIIQNDLQIRSNKSQLERVASSFICESLVSIMLAETALEVAADSNPRKRPFQEYVALKEYVATSEKKRRGRPKRINID